jgi:hypothetical protein
VNAPLFDELLARLVTARVDFVLVGGLALGAWGVVRGTKDCDVVPDDRSENLERLAAVVVELQGVPLVRRAARGCRGRDARRGRRGGVLTPRPAPDEEGRGQAA